MTDSGKKLRDFYLIPDTDMDEDCDDSWIASDTPWGSPWTEIQIHVREVDPNELTPDQVIDRVIKYAQLHFYCNDIADGDDVAGFIQQNKSKILKREDGEGSEE